MAFGLALPPPKGIRLDVVEPGAGAAGTGAAAGMGAGAMPPAGVMPLLGWLPNGGELPIGATRADGSPAGLVAPAGCKGKVGAVAGVVAVGNAVGGETRGGVPELIRWKLPFDPEPAQPVNELAASTRPTHAPTIRVVIILPLPRAGTTARPTTEVAACPGWAPSLPGRGVAAGSSLSTAAI
jgi:hypothetical protein